jgi:uncharacterized protein YrrD
MKKMSEVIGTLIYTQLEGRHIGSVQDFLFNLTSGKIQGWLIKSPHFFSKKGGLSANDIHILGEEIVLVNKADSVEWSQTIPLPSQDYCWGSEYLSTSFWERGGGELGKISDMSLSVKGDSVTGFLLGNGAFVQMGDHCRLGKDSAVLTSKDMVIAGEKSDPSFWKRIIELLDDHDH